MSKKLLFFIILLSFTVVAQEFPPLPTGYWGYLTSEGNAVTNSLVTVKDRKGVVLGTANKKTNIEGVYSIEVLWDNLNTELDEGVVAGEEIEFYAGNRLVKRTTVGTQGDNIQLDLDFNAEIEDDSSSSSSSNSPVVFDEEVSDEINKTDEEEIIIKQDSIGNNSSEKTNELLEDLDNEKSLDSIENQEFEEQNKNKIIGVLIKIIPVFLILILIILIYKLKKGVK